MSKHEFLLIKFVTYKIYLITYLKNIRFHVIINAILKIGVRFLTDN